MQAIILAAGLGSRLQPLTDTVPKALVDVAGKPMLQRCIENLAEHGFTRIVINIHYLGDQIAAFLNDANFPGIEIIISDERSELKDTGGALVHALPYFDSEQPVLIYNTDVLSDFDLTHIIAAHVHHRADATLLVQDRQSQRKLIFDPSMHLKGWVHLTSGEVKGNQPTPQDTLYAFTGIHVIQPQLIRRFKDYYGTKPFPMIPAYLHMLDTCTIMGYELPDDKSWLEIGTMERLQSVRAHFEARKD